MRIFPTQEQAEEVLLQAGLNFPNEEDLDGVHARQAIRTIDDYNASLAFLTLFGSFDRDAALGLSQSWFSLPVDIRWLAVMGQPIEDSPNFESWKNAFSSTFEARKVLDKQDENLLGAALIWLSIFSDNAEIFTAIKEWFDRHYQNLDDKVNAVFKHELKTAQTVH